MRGLLNLAQVVAANYPQIATQDSGVSWGALIGIVTVIVAGGSAALGFLWRAISKQFDELKAQLQKLDTKIDVNYQKHDDKVEKVEAQAREARANQWQEHNALRDRVTKSEARAEAAVVAHSNG